METTTTVSQRPPAGVQKRRKPSGETSHVCPFCGRAFKRSEHKERHVRTHTKEKPFVCHCGSAFTRRDLLTRHQRIATHEKLQDAHDAKSEQSGVPPLTASNIGPDLTSPISPTEISINAWEQHGHLNSGYPDANASDEMLNHQYQQSILHQDYYQGQGQGQALPMEYPDFEGFAQFDPNGLPVGWDANAYFQPPDTGESYVDPQLQETISISI